MPALAHALPEKALPAAPSPATLLFADRARAVAPAFKLDEPETCRPSSRSAPCLTVYRWPSSWPPRAPDCFRPYHCWPSYRGPAASKTPRLPCACFPTAHSTCRRANRPYGRPSTGATTCSPSKNKRCSVVWPFFGEAEIWQRSGRFVRPNLAPSLKGVMRRLNCYPRSATRVCCTPKKGSLGRPASGCCA